MTDETNPPTGDDQPGTEPEPGSTDWLLAQLSGGRIDSRRERREAEAALEAAGVPIPDATAEQPTVGDAEAPQPAAPLPQAAQAEAAETETVQAETAQPETVRPEDFSPKPAVTEERPRGRFSWDTGRVEAVDSPAAAPAVPAEVPAPPSSMSFDALTEATLTGGEPVIPFMWNLAPTHDPDPALNPPVSIPEPSFDEPDFPFPSAAPIVVPKPAARPANADASADAPAAEPAPAEPAAAEPAPAEASASGAGAATEAPAQPAVPPEPESESDTEPGPATAPEPAAPATTAAPAPAAAPAPLPPGTTAHEFDPFAQDLFAPVQATTPVPSVDEFTIPDEGTSVPASASAPVESAHDDTDRQHVSSDWSDIADMLGAHPETVDTAIVSPMPPVNEILPSFDAILPRGAAKTPESQAAEPTAPGHDLEPAAVGPFAQAPVRSQTPPPVHPANAPVEHARGGSPLNRWLLIAAAILLAILIGIGLFALGRAVAAGHDQTPAAATHTSKPTPVTTAASPTPTPTPTESDDPAVTGSGPLTPGQSYQWDQLRGGECLDPFDSPWDQTFSVVDCTAPHAAQLVYTAPFSTDPSAAFPGEQQIASQIGLLCSKPGVIDLNAAAAYSDVQVAASYPVNAAQWAAGQRNYSCFVTRSSGQQFSSSIAGPGPTQ